MRERKQCFSAQKAMFYDSQSVGLFLEELKESEELKELKPIVLWMYSLVETIG
jgi:hypothetical protein